MSHAVGLDDATSLRGLYEFFRRCLRRGHWQLALACLPQLCQSPKAAEAEEIVRALVTVPYLLSYDERHTPEKLSWFWLCGLDMCFEWNKKQVPEMLTDQTEFILYLEELKNDASEQALKELFEAFLHSHRGSKEDGIERLDPKFSFETISSLHVTLSQNPRLVQAILHFLLAGDTHSAAVKYNNSLLRISVDFILQTLTSLEGFTQDDSEAKRKLKQQKAENIYSILNTMHFSVELQTSDLKHLCEELFKACQNKANNLKEEQVQGCMLRKSNYGLISLYGNVASEKLNAQIIAQKTPEKGATNVLSHSESAILALFATPEQSTSWKNAYFYFHSTEKHFLEQILLTALHLLKKEDFSSLTMLLKKEFQPLRRLLVLLGWTHCQSIESVNALLCALHDSEDSCNDLILKEFCDGLMFQVEALKWCIEHSSRTVSKEVILCHLNDIESHSTLHILHDLTNLAELNEGDVLDLLQREPSVGKGEVSLNPLQGSQHRSIALFQAFCAMKYAVYALSIYAHKRVPCKDCQDSVMNCSEADVEPLRLPDKDSFSHPGSSDVFAQYLTKCQYYLDKLPPPLRLEILENVFSLMFISINDLTLGSSQSVDRGIEVDEDELEVKYDGFAEEVPLPQALTTKCNNGTSNVANDIFEGSPLFCENYLNLTHFTSGLAGFVVDDFVLEKFLTILKDNLEELKVLCKRTTEAGNEEPNLFECTKDTFSSRVLTLSKYISEAQWRSKLVMSNWNTGSFSSNFPAMNSGRNYTAEDQKQCFLIPRMLSPPESLLISCILRGNYIEGHQVALMFNLQSSTSHSELVFMECYEEVVRELSRVEQKIENQMSESNVRRMCNNRSTLQAIGNAAAAGMVFYSISDVMDKLLSPTDGPIPTLQDDFWTKSANLEKTDPWMHVVEELNPSAMTAFDLACTQARVWKTCKQLLEAAERRLYNNCEIKGSKPDSIMDHPAGIQGLPRFLQQMSKIITYPCPSQEQSELEDKICSQLKCSITEVLHTCYTVMTNEYIVREITLCHELEQITIRLKAAITSHEPKGNLPQALIDRLSIKTHDVQTHPVFQEMSLLLKNLEKSETSLSNQSHNSKYIKSFFTHVNTLAKVVIQSLNPEIDLTVDLKVGNPFIFLQQNPSQLISHLLFERQVLPERLSSLLDNENLLLNVEQVIADCCCEPLLFWNTMKSIQARSLLDNITQTAVRCVEASLPDMQILVPCGGLNTGTNHSMKQSSPMSDANQYFLTMTTLNFLKSKSKLTAAMACFSASIRQKPPKSSLSWMELRSNKKENPLEADQIAKECDVLLSDFPVLQRLISVMSAPFLSALPDGSEHVMAIRGKLRTSLISLGFHSSTATEIIADIFQKAVSETNWEMVFQILDSFTGEIEGLEAIKDGLLSCAAAEEKDGWRYLLAVNDPVLRSTMALRFLDKWPLDAAEEILDYCLSEMHINNDLKRDLQSKTKELEMYQKILGVKKDLMWSSWQDLKKDCVDNPHRIISIVLEAKDYVLCEDWALFYPIPTELLISLHCEHLLHLLQNKDTERSLQLLQRMKVQELQLAITEQALLQNTTIFACHFLSDYLLSHFQNVLSETRRHEIQYMFMGSKILLLLPESAHSDYQHLISNPLLLVEQLLMNMKIGWASVAVQTVQHLLAELDCSLCIEDIDILLCTYAGKALDIPFSFRERKSDTSRIPESSSHSAESETITSLSPTDQPTSSVADWSRFQTPPASQEKCLRRNKSSPEFVPPNKPPAKTQWIPDETEIICMVCKSERFTMFNRRHHCRRCGRLVCSSCSMNKMVVEGCRENPARVCDQCHNYFCASKTQDETEHTEAKKTSVNLAEVLKLSKAAEVQWWLTLNEAENEVERNEFYYEQAPSASLCSAILNLHSKCDECGYQLIERCCMLSKALTNPEMDSRLLLDIMKSLLFSAKMIFVKAARSHDLALCDSYSSKVDLLKILVAASYQDIPSLDEIIRPAAVIRLRNRLLEAEYYNLAIEVSTKTGLDPAGVWHAWGMACLKSDNLAGAREKFSRCMKPPLDPNQKSTGSKLLEDVVQYLESVAKPILLVKDDDYFATLKELEVTLKARCIWYEMMPEGKVQNNTYYQECLHYLHTYGTHLEIIQFYIRHELMREALLHLLNKECPGDIFIEGIFVPSYESGKLHTLENMLESIDPSLHSWSSYLIDVCKYLQQKNFYNILYEIQQFMKDHVRAAMTCIRFFSHKAKNYGDLGNNQKWLIKSKDHLKIYLQELSRSGRKKSFDTFRKKMSPSDISRHINTVELQMEITKFLQRCQSLATTQVSNKPPPTLFGRSSMMIDVACMVIVAGKNVEEGFGIAFRVIQDFQLDAAKVYSKVCNQLVQREHYSEILQLVKCVSESGVATENDCDQILLQCIEGMVDMPSDEREKLIQGMRSDENKIKAFLACHMLRSAYLTAVKQEPGRAIQLVQMVWQAASDFKDPVVQGICSKWLAEHPQLQKEVHKQSTRK
ncbi:zinc finger FYVE domain-containing protein 26 [Spea bombifrons]|uniref:zinc finger FYVE domain-containing protein 26 n=1 Tax=Spea bombifrons TaxID=233779 RepID=UPI00234B481B|nr:zinc finger FYVE domain-containing protein 26 [Spea bombifrons]